MSDFDLIIRGGTIVDGLRTPRFAGDIGIKDGKVAVITGTGGLDQKTATKNIDAKGQIVAPGFVDLHTHYDAQVFWDPYCTTGGWHGVTSVVIGNCGFGLAPATPELRERAMLTLTRNEAISYQAMKAGLPWNWETIPEYMNSVENTPKGVNILTYVPLAPLMTLVMGGTEAAKAGRPSKAQLAEMKRIISEAIDAGACGISAQILGATSVQRDYDGTPMVTDIMHFDDFLELCSVLKEKGGGVVQVLGIDNEKTERVCEVSGATVIYNVLALECDQHGMKSRGSWEEFADWMADANRRGLRVAAQTVITGIDYEFTFEDWNLYDYSPHWRDLCMGSSGQRLEKMKDPARRAAIRDEYDALRLKELADINATEKSFDEITTGLAQFRTVAENAVILVEREDMQQFEGMTIAQIAKQENKHPCDAILDLAVADELRTTFATPPNHYNLNEMRKLLLKPYTIPGISDGGAHMKFACFGRYPTEYLVKYVREHQLVDLEYAHWHLSAAPAHYAGLFDRGTIRVGAPADIIVYDLAELGWTEAEKVYDMPAEDWRRVTRGIGYRYTIVNGEITFVDGECTGATPGVLLRHGHA